VVEGGKWGLSREAAEVCNLSHASTD